MVELTIEQACQHPANFMYIWVSDEFLAAIPRKYALKVAQKRVNQRKVLWLSAEKFGTTQEAYQDAIRAAFIDAYGMTPAEALVTLAQGGSVAGKNWEKGVYGIGAIGRSEKFAGHDDVLVRASDGHILKNGTDITDTNRTVYSNIKGKVAPLQLFAVDTDGTVYMSQYHNKKYYAESYTTADGQKMSARSGSALNSSDGADIWGNIQEGVSWLGNILSWILSIFGIKLPTLPGSTSTEVTAQKEPLSTKNTMPDQKADGFCVGEASIDPMVAVALLGGAALVGYVLIGGKKKKSK